MLTLVVIVLLASLNAVSYAKPVGEITEEMTKNSTTQNYYPADMLNLITLGSFGKAKKYLFGDQMMTWMEASYFCNAHGMDLVTIESKEENDLLVEHITSLGTPTFNSKIYWTSGHKIGRSTWLWINGENMIFSDWASGQPSYPATEHCLIIFMGNWHSYPCHYLQSADDTTSFICEERVVV